MFRIGDGDVNIGGLRTFTDFDHLRLGIAGRIRIKNARIEFARWNNIGRKETLRIRDDDKIAPFWKPVDSIKTAIVSLVHLVVHALIVSVPRPVVWVELDEIDPLFNHRPAL